jgi:hypothetical protein
MRCLIGIDDTDNLESRGTGFRARQLGVRLAEAALGKVRGITRHQLFVHPSIPYTSHNSSACLDVDVDEARIEDVGEFCRRYLAQESAEGSDAGLCLAAFDAIADEMVAFGRSAKDTIRTQDEARALAARHGTRLEGVTGDQMGVIGALAAIGLRRGGHDGRFIWLDGVRELTGTMTAGALLATTGIDSVESRNGCPLPMDAEVLVDPWPRPVLLHGKAVLLTEPDGDRHESGGWRILCKEDIRRY